MVTHVFKDESFGVGHVSDGACACKPVREVKMVPVTRGRRGKHQGYRHKVTFVHNKM